MSLILIERNTRILKSTSYSYHTDSIFGFMKHVTTEGSNERHPSAAWNSSATLLWLRQTWCEQLWIFRLVSFFAEFVKEHSTKCFLCEGSQLWWHWLLDWSWAYACLWWPRTQVLYNDWMNFIRWWTIFTVSSGLVLREILKIGGATIQQLSSTQEPSV